MRRIFVMILSCIWMVPVYSQAYFKVTPYDTLGTSYMRVYYEMKFMPDTLDRTNFDKRYMILDVGKDGLSCFMERNDWCRDSISESKRIGDKISDTDLNNSRRLAGRVYDGHRIVKSYPNADMLFFRGRADLDQFRYEERKPDFKWELKPVERKKVAGYECTLAMGSYAGRTYKVWYTTEIPVSDGPWKFCGLPGLILEVEDLSGEYFYTCTKIQKRDGFIAVRDVKKAIETTRERFLKAFQRSKEDPGAIVQSLGDKVQGDVLKKKRRKRAYNPQEKY